MLLMRIMLVIVDQNTTRQQQVNLLSLKQKKIGSKLHDNNKLDTEIVVSLKYLSNFRRSLNLLLINSRMELDSLRSTKFIITQIYNMLSNPNANPPNPSIFQTSTYHATFQINHTKTYSH